MAATKMRSGFRACICGIDLREEAETFVCKFCDREVCSTCITRDRTRCIPCLKENPMAVSTKSTQSDAVAAAKVAERKARKPGGVEARAAAKSDLGDKASEQLRGAQVAKKAAAARKVTVSPKARAANVKRQSSKVPAKRTTGTRTANTPIDAALVKKVISMRKGGMGWPELLAELGQKRSFIHRVRPLMRKVDASSISATGRASEAYGKGKAAKPAPKASPKVRIRKPKAADVAGTVAAQNARKAVASEKRKFNSAK